MLVGHVGDAIRLVGGVGEGVAAAGRVGAVRRRREAVMKGQLGAERLDDLVLLLQLLAEPVHTSGLVTNTFMMIEIKQCD